MPLISVIIPTYNGGQFIARTLQSVLDQTFQDFEILVVDDGSVDNTAEVVQQFTRRIRYFRKPNGGPASARNFGLRRAKGNYIALLDHDDLWLPKRLETQLPLFDKDPKIGVVFSDCYIKATNDSVVPETSFQEAKPFAGEVFEKLFLRNFVPSLTTLVRRECFDCVGFFDESGRMTMTDDYHMWLRIAVHYRYAFHPKPLAVYYRHSSNFSNKFDQFIKEILNVLEDISWQFPQQVAKLGWKRNLRLADLEYKLGKFYYQSNNLQSKTHLLKAIRVHPFYWKPYLVFAMSLCRKKR